MYKILFGCKNMLALEVITVLFYFLPSQSFSLGWRETNRFVLIMLSLMPMYYSLHHREALALEVFPLLVEVQTELLREVSKPKDLNPIIIYSSICNSLAVGDQSWLCFSKPFSNFALIVPYRVVSLLLSKIHQGHLYVLVFGKQRLTLWHAIYFYLKIISVTKYHFLFMITYIIIFLHACGQQRMTMWQVLSEHSMSSFCADVSVAGA